MSTHFETKAAGLGPPDALLSPRYAGIRTFARLATAELDDPAVEIGIVGIPFDASTSYRPGARFGPEGVRAASALLRPYHRGFKTEVLSASVRDCGDLQIVPGNATRTLDSIHRYLSIPLEAGATMVSIGGDHLVTLGELRAYAGVHGPLGLVLFDAHADVWDEYYGERLFHGTVFRRAVEENLVLPEYSTLIGMRGSLYSEEDAAVAQEFGFAVIDGLEVEAMTPEALAASIKARLDGRPAFLSFDIDVIDPAFAPGTGTPEVSGLLPHAAQAYLRALAGVPFVGFDLVEVSPAYDTDGQTTALVAANLIHDFLGLHAVATAKGDK
jgi:agmatinase